MRKLGVVMDPWDRIKPEKDSTIAMLHEAQHRGYEIWYFTPSDLYLRDGQAFGIAAQLSLHSSAMSWCSLASVQHIALREFSLILMRKDPPFDLEYLYTTFVLEQAEREGVLVTNRPQAVRDANEKLYLSWFPQCCPPTLVTSKISLLREFLNEFKDIIIKPLDRMGGRGIFRVKAGDENTSVIFETATGEETQTIMAQQYLSAIHSGDKRILLIGGQSPDHALVRIPKAGELRGNIVAGAMGVAQPLTSRDRELCAEVGPTLRAKGLWFVGLDVIGEFITEINVTSPTGIRELDAQTGSNLASDYFNFLEAKLIQKQ